MRKICKKVMATLLIAAMLMGIIPGLNLSLQAYAAWDGTTIATSFAGGDGSAGNPYQIANAEQLAYMASVINTSSAGAANLSRKLLIKSNLI